MDQDLNLAVMWYLIFVFSSVCHEAAHAFLAMKPGDPTAYEGGQVSFNPIPHIRREPFGMIVVPLLTSWFQGWMLGWASAPYDPIWAGRHPKRAASGVRPKPEECSGQAHRQDNRCRTAASRNR